MLCRMKEKNNSIKFTEDDLQRICDKLGELEQKFINEAKIFLQVGQDNNLYTMDLYTAAIINRSISLMKGFVTLAKKNNYISAVPLIRIQLDNCLRFYAATLVTDYNNFFIEYLRGTHIRNIKDASEKKMTDNYLITKLDKIFPGVLKLYKNSSGHIHLSKEHSFLQTEFVSKKDRTIKTRIGHYDFYSIYKKVDFTYNMLKASEILLDLTRSWKFQKRDAEMKKLNK